MKTEIAYLIEQKHEHETCGIIPMWLCIGEKHLENDLNNEKLLNWTNNPNDEKLQKFKTYEDALKMIKAGADRIGSSSSVTIIEQAKQSVNR